MTDRLHRLIDGKAPQPVINERVATLLEEQRSDLARIGTDHEKRIRFLEKTVNYTLGAIGAVVAIAEAVRLGHEVFFK